MEEIHHTGLEQYEEVNHYHFWLNYSFNCQLPISRHPHLTTSKMPWIILHCKRMLIQAQQEDWWPFIPDWDTNSPVHDFYSALHLRTDTEGGILLREPVAFISTNFPSGEDWLFLLLEMRATLWKWAHICWELLP